jgi:hypothetical protein
MYLLWEARMLWRLIGAAAIMTLCVSPASAVDCDALSVSLYGGKTGWPMLRQADKEPDAELDKIAAWTAKGPDIFDSCEVTENKSGFAYYCVKSSSSRSTVRGIADELNTDLESCFDNSWKRRESSKETTSRSRTSNIYENEQRGIQVTVMLTKSKSSGSYTVSLWYEVDK